MVPTVGIVKSRRLVIMEVCPLCQGDFKTGHKSFAFKKVLLFQIPGKQPTPERKSRNSSTASERQD